jgi:type III pantothenate kinase
MRRLVLDIGNTRTVMGLLEEGELRAQWRVGTSHWTADELWVLVRSLLELPGSRPPGAVAFASVVPQVRHSMYGLCDRYLGVEPVEVGPSTAGIEIGYLFPHELGPDRLANAAGALRMDRAPAIVADFGTATTFDVIDAAGRYAGGAISPGVGTSAADMFKKAERLNPVDLEFPRTPLGRTTAEAIRSGVLYSAVGAADHMVGLLSECVEGEPVLWATGGWARGIGPRCSAGFRVCPELTLLGIDEIGRRNSPKGGSK